MKSAGASAPRWCALVRVCARLAALAGLALPAVSAQTGRNDNTVYNAAALMSVIVKCPDRIWPEFNWRDMQAVFVDPATGQAALWKDRAAGSASSAPNISMVEASEFGSEPGPSGHFQFMMYRNAPTVVVWRTPGQSEGDLVNVAIHETFHRIGQDKMPGTGTRGDRYPEDWEARYLRFELVRSLGEALGGSQRALRRAAYWRGELLAKHSADVASTKSLDLHEGTAQFVGALGSSLAMCGCEVSDGKLLAHVRKRRDMLHQDIGAPIFFKDGESYTVGLLAGLCLMKRRVPEWQSQAAAGQDPMATLLQDVKPKAVKPDARIAEQYRQFYERQNKETGAVVESFKERIRSGSWWVVCVSGRAMQGSFGTRGFVNFEMNGLQSLAARGVDAVFAGPAMHGRLELHGQDIGYVQLSLRPNEPSQFNYFPIENEALKRQPDGTYSITNEHIHGTALRPERTHVNGSARWMILR
jgi:hypothetical protein